LRLKGMFFSILILEEVVATRTGIRRFCKVQFGEPDYRDLMTFMDDALKTFRFIDPKHLEYAVVVMVVFRLIGL